MVINTDVAEKQTQQLQYVQFSNQSTTALICA